MADSPNVPMRGGSGADATQHMMRGEPSGYSDSFARDSLPPREQWPEMSYVSLPELAYPGRLNCAVELLDRMVDSGYGDRTVFHFPGGRWSYRQLQRTANRMAHALTRDLGLERGNRVLLRGPNNPEMAAAWFAVLKAGGICVCTMPLLRPRELGYIAEKAQVRLALTDPRVAADLEAAARTTPVLERVVPFSGGADSLEALTGGKPDEFPAVDTAADDVAIIAFTSGTTGQAKGTMHFHRDVLAICDCFPRYVLKPESDDVFCGSPPFAFTFGLGGILLFPMRVGASTLLLEQAAPPHLIKGIQDFGATICFTAPTAYRAMTPLVKQHDIRTLRKCVSAGETLPLATFEAWREATGIKIIDGIGSTEMLHIFISASEADIRPGSTGRPVPGYEAKLVNEDGRDVAAGEIGRLAVRGPTGCRYLGDRERQRGYVQNGWNITGDAYRMDDDGYFWYQARNDDMIISSGYNLSGPEVENVLLEHPGVQECGVVGVPDPERGQIVKAYVVLRTGIERSAVTVKELQEHVKKELAPYKYPRSIEFVDALPRTETGKLQRFRLRERGA
ncbi:MAG: benzoate-CoA ligase family protein [Gemmatimonadaceae bacterium]